MIGDRRIITACPISCSIVPLKIKKRINKGSRSNFPHAPQAAKLIERTRGITFSRLFGVGLRFTPLSESSRLLAGRIAVRFQIIDSRHYLIHASTPRTFLVSTCYGRIKKTNKRITSTKNSVSGTMRNDVNHGLTLLALLLYSLGLLAGFVAFLETQSARPRVGIRVAFRPLTLYVSARRGAAGCCISRRETSIETIGRNVDQANRER